MKRIWSKWWHYPLVLLLLATGCNQVKKIVTRSTPREAFLSEIKQSPLKEKPFVQNWKNAWANAAADPVKIVLPYEEKGIFFPEDHNASAFQMDLRQGEKISVQISSPVNVYAEFYACEGLDQKPIEYFEDEKRQFSTEIQTTGCYLLIVQPELLTQGGYTLTVVKGPSVGFPVAGLSSKSIQSFWGAVRDGGRRSHEGVDIFAPRGTPVLAVAPGVAHASSNRLGGKVVWHRGETGENFYYAHLDSQAVTHREVQIGDTLGFVGNTGNARYTPPHLHFGVYYRGRGAVDPFPYIDNLIPDIPGIKTDTNWQRQLAVVASKAANFRKSPALTADPDSVLTQHTVVSLKSATKDWYRVALPNGENGFIHASVVDTLRAVPKLVLPTDKYPTFSNPWIESGPTDTLYIAESPEVFGAFGEHWLIRYDKQKYIWIPQPDSTLL